MGVLLLIRHGQASFGAEDYDVLSDLGRRQSRRLGRELADQGVVPDVVVHGGMRRQVDTAAALVEEAGWSAPTERDDRWAEFDHLAVMSSRPRAARALDRRAFQADFERATRRWTEGDHDEEYAETFGTFSARVTAALDEVATSLGSGGSAVVATSGGCIAVVAAWLLDPPHLAPIWHRLNVVTVNASVTRVVVGSAGPRLLTFNEHSHLDRDLVTYR